MIIQNLKMSEKNGRHRISANVRYEDAKKDVLEIFFEVSSEFKDYLKPSYEAFLFSCFPAALYHQEKRIKIEGKICPVAKANVSAAMHLQKKWFKDKCHIPIIESLGEKVLRPIENGAAGCFLSGGVDSLSNFCRNITNYPVDHVNRFSVAIFVYGMDIGDPNKPLREDIFKQAIEKLTEFTSSHDCQMIPVYTNARDIEPHWVFYAERHHGSVLAGIAHSLSNGLRSCSIALDHRSEYYLHAWGSNALLNKYFSSSYFSLESHMDDLIRTEKYKPIKKIPGALENLRVCYTIGDIGKNSLNCGHCEKCIRTKLELMVNGLLDKVTTFPDNDVTLDDVRKLKLSNPLQKEYFQALVDELPRIGRSDMAHIIQRELDHPSYTPPVWKKIREALRELDENWFKGSLLNCFRFLKRSLSGSMRAKESA